MFKGKEGNMMTEVLKAKFIKEEKIFEIEMTKNESIKIESSGLFDTEREILDWASQHAGKALGYLDGSEKHQYVLVYGMDIYDVEVDE